MMSDSNATAGAGFRGLGAASLDPEPFERRARGAVFIVANSEYRNYPKLLGPPSDLRLLQDHFSSIGLCVVTLENVPNRAAFMNALDSFVDRLKVSEAASGEFPVLFHYSGHGYASRSGNTIRNLLVMTDAQRQVGGDAARPDTGFVILDDVIDRMASLDGIKLAVMIDACRVEPSTRGSVVADAQTFAQEGSRPPELWVENDRSNRPSWLGVYFSAAFGKPALDYGVSGSSPYAEAIAKAIQSGKRWHRRLRAQTFDKLMDEVGNALRGRQDPREQTVGRDPPVLIHSIGGIRTAAMAASFGSLLILLAGAFHYFSSGFIPPETARAVEACHITTAAVEDVDHPVASRRFTLFEMRREGHARMKTAVEACRKAFEARRGDRRLQLQLGRAIESEWRTAPCNRSFDRPKTCGQQTDDSALAEAFHHVNSAFGDGAFEPARWTLIQYLMNGVGRSRAEQKSILADTARAWRLASEPIKPMGPKAEEQRLEYETNRCVVLDDDGFKSRIHDVVPSLTLQDVETWIFDACEYAAKKQVTSARLRLSYMLFYREKSVSKKEQDDAFSLVRDQIAKELSNPSMRVESSISLADTAFWLWKRPGDFVKDGRTFWNVMQKAVERLKDADRLAREENPQKPSTYAANMICQIWFNPARQSAVRADAPRSADEHQLRLGLKFSEVISTDKRSGYCDRAANDKRALASLFFRAAYYGLNSSASGDHALARQDLAAFVDVIKKPDVAKLPDAAVDLVRARFLESAIDLILLRKCAKPGACEETMALPSHQATADNFAGVLREIAAIRSSATTDTHRAQLDALQANAKGALMATLAAQCDVRSDLLRASAEADADRVQESLEATLDACAGIVAAKLKDPDNSPYALPAAKWYRALSSLLSRKDREELAATHDLRALKYFAGVALGARAATSSKRNRDWLERNPSTQSVWPNFQTATIYPETPGRIEEIFVESLGKTSCSEIFQYLESQLVHAYRFPKDAPLDQEWSGSAAGYAHMCPTIRTVHIILPRAMDGFRRTLEKGATDLIALYNRHFPNIHAADKIVVSVSGTSLLPQVSVVPH